MGGGVLFLCTGNAARSVMAGVALRARRPDLTVETAGTLTVDGLPISWRTRKALDDVGLASPDHRSRQAGPTHLEQKALIVGLAPEHILWVRREHPEAAARAGTLARLARDLPSGGEPLPERVAELQLDEIDLEPWEEVVDPGGGEVDVFVACAHQIVELVDQL